MDGGDMRGRKLACTRGLCATIAGALLLTLVFRSAASHVLRVLTTRMGAARIRRVLEARSSDVLHDFILPGALGKVGSFEQCFRFAHG